MTQNDLFDPASLARGSFPMARATDPDTSHEAAERQRPKLSERRAQVLGLVAEWPLLTSTELGRKFYEHYGDRLPIGVCASTPNKRLPELEKMGFVERGVELRECTDTGYRCHTWILTAAGRGALLEIVKGLLDP